MNEKTSVILITGFLGSGKTTFLKRIIKNFPEDRKLTILMNEFGEIGIDGMLVEGNDIDLLEISRGSIFCACVKTDFIKGLYELHSSTKPDILIIESTGVANPADLRRDLRLPIFHDRFQFSSQICIIDAAHFLEAYKVFAAVEKQLSTSTVFIINKTDLTNRETLNKIKEVILQHHPEPSLIEATYSDVPLDFLPSLMINTDASRREKSLPVPGKLSIKELDEFIHSILDNPELETIPPDQLASVTYYWHGENLSEIREMAKSLPAAVVRAKGFVQEHDLSYLFNYVMGDWTIESTSRGIKGIQHANTIVFVGTFAAITGIGKTLSPPYWSVGKVLQPFAKIDRI